MHTTISLAIGAKAKLVFESEDTFLGFTISPIIYTTNQLRYETQVPAAAAAYAPVQPTAQEILQAQYARGEITREQKELQLVIGSIKEARDD